MTQLTDLIARWDSGDGKPYKGELIDIGAYDPANPDNIGCMCAQGQVLHVIGGWSVDDLKLVEQAKADREVAKLLNISRGHAVLLRNVNDSVDGAPSIVLTDPAKVLGDQAHIVLAFWLHLDGMSDGDWQRVDAAIRVSKAILALALVLAPIPASSAEPQVWVERTAFHAKLKDLVQVGTDGALLGAAVDLFDFALAPKGWYRSSSSYHTSCDGEAIYVATLTRHEDEPEDPPHTIRSTNYVSDAAALIAAMEEVEI